MQKKFHVPAEEEGARLDKYLSAVLESHSRAQIKRMLDDGAITVDGTRRKPSHSLKEGEIITVEIEKKRPFILKHHPMDIEIVHEDAHLMVVNKPSGLIVHPTETTEETTLVEGLLDKIEKDAFDDPFRPGIVHRLDKDTSGLLLVAKNQSVLNSLQESLKERDVNREYMAIVEGVVDHSKGKIVAPIGRHPKKRHLMAVTEGGKESITHFETVERFKAHTLVKCRLETGRTHQIRVHMKYIGHPVVGDNTYGHKKKAEAYGQYLHAFKIAFTHPVTEEHLTFEAKLPRMFENKLNSLRGTNAPSSPL